MKINVLDAILQPNPYSAKVTCGLSLLSSLKEPQLLQLKIMPSKAAHRFLRVLKCEKISCGPVFKPGITPSLGQSLAESLSLPGG